MASPSLNRPPVPSWGSLDATTSTNSKQTNKPNPSSSHAKTQRSNSTTAQQLLPINLSLSEDERSPPNRANSNDSTQSPQQPKSALLLPAGGSGTAGQGQSGAAGGHNPLASPLEAEDMLYEYFPLSLDDW